MEIVKVKILNTLAKMPTFGSDCAAGADLYAATDYDLIVRPGETLKIGTGLAMAIPTGYYGAIFDRDISKKEVVDSVGVTLSSYCNIEVYINPMNSNIDITKMKKVTNLTEEMNPGYHRIYIEPTTLEGNQFSIVIKQITNNESFYMEIEAPEADSPYVHVDSDNKSYVSFDGKNWDNLKDLNVLGIDMSKSDACIKVFTDEEKEEIVEPNPDTRENEENEEIIEIKSNVYEFKGDYIYNIRYETDIEEFKNSINTNSLYLEIIHNGRSVNTGRITTGMKLRLSDGKEYTLIVRGDTNLDGRITITDLSKIILHYNDTIGFILNLFKKQ